MLITHDYTWLCGVSVAKHKGGVVRGFADESERDGEERSMMQEDGVNIKQRVS